MQNTKFISTENNSGDSQQKDFSIGNSPNPPVKK